MGYKITSLQAGGPSRVQSTAFSAVHQSSHIGPVTTEAKSCTGCTCWLALVTFLLSLTACPVVSPYSAPDVLNHVHFTQPFLVLNFIRHGRDEDGMVIFLIGLRINYMLVEQLFFPINNYIAGTQSLILVIIADPVGVETRKPQHLQIRLI